MGGPDPPVSSSAVSVSLSVLGLLHSQGTGPVSLQGHKKGLALALEGEVDAAVVGALRVPVADDAGQGSTHLLAASICFAGWC